MTKQKGDVGSRLSVQISVIDHHDNEHREWVCHRAVRENVDDIFDVPPHLLQPGHAYEFNVKLLSPDQSSVDDDDSNNRLMRVISTKKLNFRSGMYATRGPATDYYYNLLLLILTMPQVAYSLSRKKETTFLK